MDIKVDGAVKGQARSWTNEVDSHKAFVAAHVVVPGIERGDHKLTLEALDGTTTDVNDYFNVAVLEL
jgi:hypothetical protein